MSLSSEVPMIALSSLPHAVACWVEIAPSWRSDAWDHLHMQTVDSNRLSLEAFSDICAHVAPCHCISNDTQSSADNRRPWTPPSLHGLNKGNLVWCKATWTIFLESFSCMPFMSDIFTRPGGSGPTLDDIFCKWFSVVHMTGLASYACRCLYVYCLKRSTKVESKKTYMDPMGLWAWMTIDGFKLFVCYLDIMPYGETYEQIFGWGVHEAVFNPPCWQENISLPIQQAMAILKKEPWNHTRWAPTRYECLHMRL